MSDELAPGTGDPRWQRRPLRSLVVQNVRTLGVGALAVVVIVRREIETWVQGGTVELRFAAVLALIVAGLTMLVAVGNVVTWRRFTFAVTDDGLHVRRGGLSTTAATFSPERIDGVSVSEPLLERVAGLATLKVEVSGGSSSNAEVPGIPRAQAQEWRERLLARRDEVAAERHAVSPAPAASAASDVPTSPSATGAPSDPSAALPPDSRGRLVLAPGPERARRYTLRSVQPWTAGAACVVLLGAGVADAVSGGVGGAIGLLLAGGAAGTGAVSSALERWRRVSTWEVHERDGDLAVSQGRLHRRRTTVRAGRVSAIELGQGPLDRRSGWWTLRVSVTAFGESAATDDGLGTVAVAATPEEVVVLMTVLMPHLDERTLAEVRAALESERPPSTWIGAQPHARRFAPLTWRHRGLLVDAAHLVVQSGRWARRLRVIDRGRIQTTSLERGPLDRRLGGAALTVHLPPGPTRRTTVPHLDAVTARVLRDDLALSRPRGAGG